MIKACIFDLDGTVVNSLNSIAYFANAALVHFGYSPIDVSLYKEFVGDGATKLVQRMVTYLTGSDEGYEKVLKYYNETYDNNFLYLAEAYDGIINLLNELKGKNIKIGILSNKPDSTTKKITSALFGDKLIDICFGGRDGIPLKPNPDSVIDVMKRLNVSPADTLYIGDTKTDILTGKNAQITTVGVLWGFRDREELEAHGADYIISEPAELISLLEQF